MQEDPRITGEEIEDTICISKFSAHQILTEKLGKRKVAAKFVPHCLIEEQKQNRVQTSAALLACQFREGQAFLNRIIAIDETRSRCYEPELKRQSVEWKSPGEDRPVKFRQTHGGPKQMLIMAYGNERLIYTHFVPVGQTVNKEYYRQFLQKLRQAVRRKCPNMQEAGPLILQDNASCHKAELMMDILQRYHWEPLPHPPYSPDLSPPDFDLFPILKESLRGKRFPDIIELTHAVKERIQEINKNHLCTGINKLPDRWRKAIEKEGDYIEN